MKEITKSTRNLKIKSVNSVSHCGNCLGTFPGLWRYTWPPLCHAVYLGGMVEEGQSAYVFTVMEGNYINLGALFSTQPYFNDCGPLEILLQLEHKPIFMVAVLYHVHIMFALYLLLYLISEITYCNSLSSLKPYSGPYGKMPFEKNASNCWPSQRSCS